MNTKKAQGAVGLAIVGMAVLLLLGGIFFDDGPSKPKSTYLDKKKTDDKYIVDGYPEENYLFYLNETEIGRQNKVTESFPNFDLGSKIEYNTVYLGNSFRLNANPFTSNQYTFDVQLSEPEDVKELLIYFDPKRITGDQELMIFANGLQVSRNLAQSSDIPIRVYLNENNRSIVRFTFQLAKPSWYSLFDWNKMDITELKVVEVKRDESNNQRDFSFYINKDNLEDVQLDLLVSCDEVKEISEPIKATINGYIVANVNPQCTSKNNRITRNVSLSILNNGNNKLVLETDGYYRLAYSVNKIYYNDQEVYKFNINSFNDIIDVVMYGDFDREVIDIRINTQTMSLRRDEIKSIVPYLRFGTNEIKFLNKPLEIKEFVIEKNEFIY